MASYYFYVPTKDRMIALVIAKIESVSTKGTSLYVGVTGCDEPYVGHYESEVRALTAYGELKEAIKAYYNGLTRR